MNEYEKIAEEFRIFQTGFSCKTSRENDIMNEAMRMWGALISLNHIAGLLATPLFSPKKYVVLEDNERERFENRLNEASVSGGKILSSSCGFVDSAQYDFCSNYQAIIEINEPKDE